MTGFLQPLPPFIIRRDGAVFDRESGQALGAVDRDSLYGWVGWSFHVTGMLQASTRKGAATRVYHAAYRKTDTGETP